MSEIKKLYKLGFSKPALETAFDKLVDNQLQRLLDFGVYESKFYAKVLTKYLKKDVKPQSVIKNNLLAWPLPLGLRTQVKSVGQSYEIFKHKKIVQIIQAVNDAQIQKRDAKGALDEIFAGLFTAQAKALVTTSVHCVCGNVRMLF